MEEFPSESDYNDYLEQVEDMVYNLVNEVNVQETEEKIERFRRENLEQIAANQHKASQEQIAVNSFLEQERLGKQRLREEYTKQLSKEEHDKITEKETMLNELASSNKNAEDIIRAHATKGIVYSSLPVSIPNVETLLNMQIVDPFETLEYDHSMESCFEVTSYEDSYLAPYVREKKWMRPGGYDLQVPYLRALEFAFRGLLVQNK